MHKISYSSSAIFLVSLAVFLALFMALSTVSIVPVVLIAIVLLLIIGLPGHGWFGSLNKPVLFGSQLAVVVAIWFHYSSNGV
jgi:hypothetical protein